jgi:hypothetical protein
MATKTQAAPKFARLNDRKLLAKAARLARLRKLSKSCDRVAGEEQAHILAELAERGVKSVTICDTTITRVQQAPVTSYDEDALWRDLTTAQRNAAFAVGYDLGALPRKRLAQIVATLTTEERTSVCRTWLDEARLEQAVAAGRIPAALVDAHKTVRERAASVKITDPPAK